MQSKISNWTRFIFDHEILYLKDFHYVYVSEVNEVNEVNENKGYFRRIGEYFILISSSGLWENGSRIKVLVFNQNLLLIYNLVKNNNKNKKNKKNKFSYIPGWTLTLNKKLMIKKKDSIYFEPEIIEKPSIADMKQVVVLRFRRGSLFKKPISPNDDVTKLLADNYYLMPEKIFKSGNKVSRHTGVYLTLDDPRKKNNEDVIIFIPDPYLIETKDQNATGDIVWIYYRDPELQDSETHPVWHVKTFTQQANLVHDLVVEEIQRSFIGDL